MWISFDVGNDLQPPGVKVVIHPQEIFRNLLGSCDVYRCPFIF